MVPMDTSADQDAAGSRDDELDHADAARAAGVAELPDSSSPCDDTDDCDSDTGEARPLALCSLLMRQSERLQ